MAKKNWIAGAMSGKGGLRRAAHVKTGHKIPVKTLNRLAKKPGITGQRARLAKTLRKISRKK